MTEEKNGFLGRWARRKTDVLQGKTVVEPVAAAKPVLLEPVAHVVEPKPAQVVEKPPELSLEDVKKLTKDSDFKPFMAQNVGTHVRNAAMKKLFTDPHFNVMDGLDIYIDDYSKFDPIPEAMLRAMNGSKFLKLFDDEEDEKDAEKQSADELLDNAAHPDANTVAQSPADSQKNEADSVPQIDNDQSELSVDSVASNFQPPTSHDHSHLRLQPDHALTGLEVGRSTQ